MESDHDEMASLPSSPSPSLILTHPTPSEVYKTHELSSVEWAGPLTKEQYIENEHQLASLLNITHWILTQADRSPDQRVILASCETIRKRCFVKCKDSGARRAIVQAVAAVFCEPEMRGQGYAGKMLKELGSRLQEDIVDGKETECVGSVLWSDIGPKYYADLGWLPFPSTHIEIPASPGPPTVNTRAILPEEIADLCAEDQATLFNCLRSFDSSKKRFIVVPDHRTMLWHHRKENYICQKLFGRHPNVKGAMASEAGARVWAIWTRGFYGPVDDPGSGNKLHVLRLVAKHSNPENLGRQIECLKAVLQAAQREAEDWRLGVVEIWNPDERTRVLIEQMRIEYRYVERQHEGIPSLMLFGDDRGDVEWIVSEKHAWC